MKIAQITTVEKQARERFTYKPDPKNQDTWRSHAIEVIAHRDWADDCDGLASTIIDLLNRQGVPLKDLYRLIVWAPGKVGHMVGCVYDDDGEPWIIGDTFQKTPYPAHKMVHGLRRYQRMDEVVPDDVWHFNAPFST